MKWKREKNVWISIEPILPGVWLRRDGGHQVRARVTDSTTGKLKEIWKALPEATGPEALQWLEGEKERLRAGGANVDRKLPRFAEYSTELFEHKVQVGDIKSAKGRQRWAHTLVHLINAFGDVWIDRLRAEHVERWKAELGGQIARGEYAPSTVNGWLSILRVIMKAARRRYHLTHLATEDVTDFDLSTHATYTEEEPNSLTPAEVPVFLSAMLEYYPQHYAMTFLGLVTGLRPSSLRPLRRQGPTPDVLWDKSRILVRQSQTIGDEVMNTTKQKRRYPIVLPGSAMAVLRWHVRTQLETAAQEDSDLLFPSIYGGFRAPTVLNKPFADVCEAIELGKKFTQRGLRRTFQDLCREAGVADLVTRSISGHQTEQMQEHYSTVRGAEQSAALAKVIHLFGGEHPGDHRPATGDHSSRSA